MLTEIQNPIPHCIGTGLRAHAIGRDAAARGGLVYCENCGQGNASSAIYCEKCGTLLNVPE